MRKEVGRGKNQFKIRDLADARCSQSSWDFLSTTDVGKRAGEDAQSETSEWELRERREREEERRRETGEPGAADEGEE